MSEALFQLFVESVLDTSKFDKGMETSATKVESSLSRMASAAKQYLGAGGLLWSFNRANAQAMQFGQTMADVAAITELNVDKMAKSLLKLDHIFGRPAQTGHTLYETISSGIKGTEEDLLHFVEVAGKTAKVIRADTYTTSNALTTMMHAYGISAKESTKLMDIMYTTVKEGKAHGNELARTLGLVVNNASESGIAIKDLFAAIATLSRTMTASNAMISLNQMMNSFLGPTEEARRVAREYGIEMDVAAIKSKGFAAVMKDVHDKVGGNVEAIKSLFGNIRAARGALVLTGSQFGNFIDVLHEFDRTAGEAEGAFKTQTETTQASAERMRNSFNKLQITVGKDMEGLTKTFYKFGAAVMDGFGNAEGALGGFVNSVGGNFKSDSPWIQFLNSADKLTASWSRFFLYFTVGAKIFSGFAKATASVEMAMKGVAQAGQINAAGAASAQGLGSAIPGAASEKMPSPAKIQGVAVTEPVNQINLQMKGLEAEFKGILGHITRIKDSAITSNEALVDIVNTMKTIKAELDKMLSEWNKIRKKIEGMVSKGTTISDSIVECSKSMTTFSSNMKTLAGKLDTLHGKAKLLHEKIPESSAVLGKTSTVMGNVSKALGTVLEKAGALLTSIAGVDKGMGTTSKAMEKINKALPELLAKLITSAGTLSGNLSTIALNIDTTNKHFLNAITYAGSVNAAVQTLEARLLTLSNTLAGKASPAILKTSPASKAPKGKSSSITKTSSDAPKAPKGKSSSITKTSSDAPKVPTGKSSAATTSSSDAPKVPAVQQQAKSFVATSREKAWLALLYKGETDIAPGRIKPYPKKNIKVRNMGYEGDWMFSSPVPRPRYIDRALTDGPTGLGLGTMFTRKDQYQNPISEKRIPDNDWFIRRPAKIAEEYSRPSADVIRAAMRNRRDALSAVGLSERTTFHALNRGLLLPQNAGQNGNPVLPSVSKADFAKLQKLQQQGAQYYGNQLGGAQGFPLVPTKFPPPYNDRFSNTPGNFSSRISGADYRNINRMAAQTMGRGGRLMLPAPDPQVYAGIAPETANFARKLREQTLKNTIGGTTGSGTSDIIKVISAKADKAVDATKKSFIGIGKAFSGVAKVGMGVFGAISAAQIGWSIGTQIAEKFKFSESRLYQSIADMMVGKAPGSTKKEQEEIGKYNVTMMAASARKLVESLHEAEKIDAAQYRSLLEDIRKSYFASSSEEGKRILDTLNDTLSEIAEKAKTYKDSISDSTKALSKAVLNATNAYNEQAQKVRDIENRKEYTTVEMTDIAAEMYKLTPKSKSGRELRGAIAEEDMNLPFTPVRDLLKAGFTEGGVEEVMDAEAEKYFTQIVAEKMNKFATDATIYSAEEIIDEFTEKNSDSLIAPLDFVKQIIDIRMGKGRVDQKGLQMEKDVEAIRLKEVDDAVSNMLTNMVIERANQVEKKFDETILQDKTDAINRAIAGGIDGSKIAEMKSDLLSTQARALQVIFFGIQQEIAEISKSAEFKKQSPEKQKQIMRKLNAQASTFYTRMNASMEAAAQASAKVLQGFFESLDRDVEKAMGSDLFIPSDEMLPSMHRTKVMALQGSSGKLEKKHKELIDKLDALTNTTINEYMNQKRVALEEEMSVLQKAYSDPDATEQEKGIVKMKMRGVSASIAGLNEEDARRGMMLDKNRISEDIDSVYKQWMQSLEAVNSAQRDAALSGLGRLKDLAEQLGHRKDLGIIKEDDYTKAITKNYEAQIAQLNRMLPLMVKGSDAYRDTILEMYELKKAIKDQKEAYNENRRALREGAFGTISDMTQGNNRNALYHAVNILGMMSGPNRLARLTAPSLDMQDPFTLGKAQKAQQSLAATMDSYLMSQKYEQANVGKTVTKIYDFISKNNAIVLR